MPPYLVGPRAKLIRAEAHLKNLCTIEASFFQTHPVEIVFDTQSQPGHKLVKARMQSTPTDFAIVGGEFIYQLRSCFDQIAVALARMSAAKPPVRDLYFPTGDSLKGFQDACRRYLVGFDTDLADIIKNTNCYDGGDNIFRSVFQMAKIDKHLELIPDAPAGHFRGIDGYIVANGYASIVLTGGAHNLRDGMVIADLLPNGIFRPKSPDSKIHVSGYITLANVKNFPMVRATGHYAAMLKKCIEVYNDIQRLCERTGRL